MRGEDGKLFPNYCSRSRASTSTVFVVVFFFTFVVPTTRLSHVHCLVPLYVYCVCPGLHTILHKIVTRACPSVQCAMRVCVLKFFSVNYKYAVSRVCLSLRLQGTLPQEKTKLN